MAIKMFPNHLTIRLFSDSNRKRNMISFSFTNQFVRFTYNNNFYQIFRSLRFSQTVKPFLNIDENYSLIFKVSKNSVRRSENLRGTRQTFWQPLLSNRYIEFSNVSGRFGYTGESSEHYGNKTVQREPNGVAARPGRLIFKVSAMRGCRENKSTIGASSECRIQI